MTTLGSSSGLATVVGFSESAFPPQFAGFKVFYGGTIKELGLVAEADAPTGMGGVLKFRKSGTTYALYLVETSDPHASPLRIRTTTGTKAIRVKT